MLELTGQCKLTCGPRNQDRHLLRLLNQSFPQQYELVNSIYLITHLIHHTIKKKSHEDVLHLLIMPFIFVFQIISEERKQYVCYFYFITSLIIMIFFWWVFSFHCVLYFSLHILLDELLVPERVCWAKSCRALSAAVAGCYVGPCAPSAPPGARQARVAWRHMQRGQWGLPQSHDQAQRWVQLMLWYIFTEININSRSVLCVCFKVFIYKAT